MSYNQARLRRLNDAKANPGGACVLYWAQAYRRLDHNHALDYALRCAGEMKKPLVVYEGLRLDYPWASERLHRFVLEGMRDNAAAAAALGVSYWPYVETKGQPGRGLLTRLADQAAVVVTDDFPCFIVPGHSAAREAKGPVEAPFETWDPKALEESLRTLPLDGSVPAVPGMVGGSRAAKALLREFLKKRLRGYAEDRSSPTAPAEGHASGLSPYLHFGHIAIEEVADAVLATTGDFSPEELRVHNRGKREGYFSDDADVNSFLDEALTWRDVGFQWHWTRRTDTTSLDRALPGWAQATLRAHADDQRTHVYTPEEWEAGATHDPLWNAAQRELVATGTIHNYLRMLCGKKVIEWSRSPAEAYQTLVHLNNKYALDGRDPNSYTGILWCFGLFDRPWSERPVLGVLRYMSSDNTARKFKLGPYHEYVSRLSTISEVRQGKGITGERGTG